MRKLTKAQQAYAQTLEYGSLNEHRCLIYDARHSEDLLWTTIADVLEAAMRRGEACGRSSAVQEAAESPEVAAKLFTDVISTAVWGVVNETRLERSGPETPSPDRKIH